MLLHRTVHSILLRFVCIIQILLLLQTFPQFNIIYAIRITNEDFIIVVILFILVPFTKVIFTCYINNILKMYMQNLVYLSIKTINILKQSNHTRAHK